MSEPWPDNVIAAARRTVDREVAGVVELLGTVDEDTLRSAADEALGRLDHLERLELMLLAAVLVDELTQHNLKGGKK